MKKYLKMLLAFIITIVAIGITAGLLILSMIYPYIILSILGIILIFGVSKFIYEDILN